MMKTVCVYGLKFEVEFDGTPFRPAQVYGPPEDCFPASGGEPEILTICLDGVDLTDCLADHVVLKILEDLTQHLCSDLDAERQAEAAEAREAARRDDELMMAFDRR